MHKKQIQKKKKLNNCLRSQSKNKVSQFSMNPNRDMLRSLKPNTTILLFPLKTKKILILFALIEKKKIAVF